MIVKELQMDNDPPYFGLFLVLTLGVTIHQDHQTIACEGFRAFKKVSMLGYEIPWNNLTFQTNVFVFLSEQELNKKIEAVKCYKSQQNRNYAKEDFIRGLAKTRGIQIGVDYAEAFESIRWIIH